MSRLAQRARILLRLSCTRTGARLQRPHVRADHLPASRVSRPSCRCNGDVEEIPMTPDKATPLDIAAIEKGIRERLAMVGWDVASFGCEQLRLAADALSAQSAE